MLKKVMAKMEVFFSTGPFAITKLLKPRLHHCKLEILRQFRAIPYGITLACSLVLICYPPEKTKAKDKGTIHCCVPLHLVRGLGCHTQDY